MVKQILRQIGLFLILTIFLINLQVAFDTLPDNLGISMLQYALLSLGCGFVFIDSE
jgi:hypothetical protein